ncbi:5' nucleotidase, NT5C type [Butyrivibrio sp. JL13D10]|uniref:5' nucleotidase, NT5C type n=1 Tax=Butyrivibrio sp. JL13D10 TaxID=3236815 RepID=UPI0038B5E0C5
MKIYVDFDDCLCETARAFTELVEELYGKRVRYEDMHSFNLQASFRLTDDEYEKMMIEGHLPKALLAIKETPGASEVLNECMDKGAEVCVITGRPSSAYEASREWLDAHGLNRAKLYCLNKYGRDSFIKNSEFNLELEDYYKMTFDYAIEDSPLAFKFFDHMPDLKVMVYDRPWNHDCELTGDNYRRCPDWDYIRKQIEI